MPRFLALWALLLCCADARAQVSGRVAWLSDYRFRGVSLSQDQPVLQASINVDTADGWYVGAFASRVKLLPDGGPRTQWLAYAGYAQRFASNAQWEVGVEYVGFVGHSRYDYPEIFVGISGAHLAARMYYAPRYYDDDEAVIYAEIDGAWPAGSHLRLLGHVGWLRRQESEAEEYYAPDRLRFDGRVGVAAQWHDFDLQLAWVFNDADDDYAMHYTERQGWVVSVARDW